VALHDFVDKDEKNALAECVTAALQHTQAAVVGAASARRCGMNTTLAAFNLSLPAMSMKQNVTAMTVCAAERFTYQSLRSLSTGAAAAVLCVVVR
jgi:hypothetical protein